MLQVSTDYDECDQLYFDELSKERIVDIYRREAAEGVVVSVGGQIPNNLAMPLHRAGVKILGTTPEMIDCAEDRFKFSALMDSLGIQQPAWKELADTDSALAFAKTVGYPVLVRPSYVLSGAAMSVAYNDEALLRVLSVAADVSADHPVVITKFVDGANEIEMDAVAQDGIVVAAAMHEHVENAGVHSGDATLVLPPQSISAYTAHRVNEATKMIAKALNITGPFNMQFLSKGKDVSIIECNLRASRSVPFVSKTMGVDFIEAAAKCMVGEDVSGMDLPQLGQTGRPKGYVGVKSPMFSFTRLRGADPVLGVEMASTGEVACFGANAHEAFLKALISTGFKVPEKNILLSVQDNLRDEVIHAAYQLHRSGYNLYATKATYDFLQACHVPCHLLHFPNQPGMCVRAFERVLALVGGCVCVGGATCIHACMHAWTLTHPFFHPPITTTMTTEKHPNVLEYLRDGKIDLVINLPTPASKQVENNYLMRRTAVDYGVPLLTNIHLVKLFSEAIAKYKKGELVGLTVRFLPKSLPACLPACLPAGAVFVWGWRMGALFGMHGCGVDRNLTNTKTPNAPTHSRRTCSTTTTRRSPRRPGPRPPSSTRPQASRAQSGAVDTFLVGVLFYYLGGRGGGRVRVEWMAKGRRAGHAHERARRRVDCT